MILRLAPILGITFIDILGFSILIPLMPYFVKRFGVGDVVVGLLFATFALCQFVAAPLWGNVSDRAGRKMVLIVSQIGATIGWAMLAWAPSIAWVFVARIIEGLSGGNLSVTQAYVADLVEPAQRARAFGYIGAAFGAGLIFGPSAGGWLAHQYGFAVPFLVAAGLQALTLVVTIVVLPESRRKVEGERPATPQDIVVSLRHPSLAPTLWQKLIYSLGLYGWFASFTLILALQLGFDEAAASYYFACFGVLSVIMQLGVVGRISDAIGDRRASNLGLAAVAASFVIVPFAHDLWWAAAVLFTFGFGLAVENATLPALITDAAPQEQRGTILGVGSSLESIAGIVMPPITTGALALYGVGATAAICGTFVTAALVLGIAQTRATAPASAPAGD